MEVYLIKYIAENTIEGYVTSKEKFNNWLERRNEWRETAGEIREGSEEFELIKLRNLNEAI